MVDALQLKIQQLLDQAAITDALHRFAVGLDLGDEELYASALTEDVTIDMTPASKIGLEFTVLTPRDVVIRVGMDTVGRMDSSHMLSNIRTVIDGDTARAQCYAQAEHYPPAQGSDPSLTAHALMMNNYNVDLVRDGDQWRIKHLTIDNLWFRGDVQVLSSIP
ncbi:nuclear transport factor 2 family protein [Streptomyces sp. NPDC054919]